ncbi:hypothetical protein KK062_14800 [Fulvivirgaceae bacterium PWU5]|uniref:RDD domain-containing protein n=1 Tax=Dawidia cretensis TaxID=2782350 RepID=A0AAP2DY37_9BACT|nr:hypothetical protein [Dawidia cretensis]MBT1709508.1 hypothetical protein [Dawidia cretensis]
MDRRKSYLFDALLATLSLLLIALYVYTNSLTREIHNNVVVEERFEFHNPLTTIFLESNAIAPLRLLMLAHAFFTLLLPVAAIRYWRSKRQRKQTLLASLLLYFWSGVALLIDQGFYHAWLHWMHPLYEYGDSQNFPFGVLPVVQTALSFILLRLFLPGVIGSRPDPAAEEVPLRWMRAYHGKVDGVATLLFGFKVFMTYFVYSYYDSFLPTSSYHNMSPAFASVVALTTWLVEVWISYVVTEFFFQLTPGKVLTGVMVANDHGAGRASFGKVLMRNIVRLVPFNRYSFLLGRGGWHDTLSRTQLVYWAGSHPMVRQNNLVVGASFVFGTFCCWLLVASIFKLTNQDYFLESIASAPFLLVLIFLWIFMSLLTGWLATVSNVAQNHAQAGSKTEGKHFLKIIACWIPILNFTMPAVVLDKVAENFSQNSDNPEIAETFYQLNRFFCRAFGAFSTLVYLGLLTMRYANPANGQVLAALLLSLGGIVACIAVVRYARWLNTFLQGLPATES